MAAASASTSTIPGAAVSNNIVIDGGVLSLLTSPGFTINPFRGIQLGGTTNGTNIDQRTYSGATYQQWQIVSVGGTSPTPVSTRPI